MQNWGGNFGEKIVLLKEYPSLLRGMVHANKVYSNDNQGLQKIVNFMTPKEGFFVLGRGHTSQYLKMHYP